MYELSQARAVPGVRVPVLGQGSGCRCWDRSRHALRWDAAPPLWFHPPGWSPQKAQHSHQALLGLYDSTPGLGSPSTRLGPPPVAAQGVKAQPLKARPQTLFSGGASFWPPEL